MYFSKKVYAVYNGVWGKAPEAGNFCVKSNLFTFNCKLQKKLGEHYVLVAPPIIFLGELLLPWFPCL